MVVFVFVVYAQGPLAYCIEINFNLRYNHSIYGNNNSIYRNNISIKGNNISIYRYN